MPLGPAEPAGVSQLRAQVNDDGLARRLRGECERSERGQGEESVLRGHPHFGDRPQGWKWNVSWFIPSSRRYATPSVTWRSR